MDSARASRFERPAKLFVLSEATALFTADCDDEVLQLLSGLPMDLTYAIMHRGNVLLKRCDARFDCRVNGGGVYYVSTCPSNRGCGCNALQLDHDVPSPQRKSVQPDDNPVRERRASKECTSLGDPPCNRSNTKQLQHESCKAEASFARRQTHGQGKRSTCHRDG